MNARTMLPPLIRLLTSCRLDNPVQPRAVPRIYYGNHSSNLDFLLLWASLPKDERARTRPVAAADYWTANKLRRHLAGKVFRAILIERKNVCRSNNPLPALNAALERGESLIIFPEGTRDGGGEPGQFKSGLYHLAKNHPRAELVPVWIENAFRILPKGEILPLPLICKLRRGTPLSLSDGEEKCAFLNRARTELLNLRPQ